MNHLGLFAKYWQPGQVKTRLAVKMGPQKASQIYYAFLDHLLRRLSSCGETRTIGFTPPDRRDEFRELTDNGAWGLVAQVGDDLGQRMSNFFDWAMQESTPESESKTKVVLIGSDTPQIPEDFIRTAFELLNQRQLVLGPSTDGGYYLIGMANQCLPVFAGIDWSTSKVMEQTTEHLNREQISYKLLPELTDVDELADLQQLTLRLESESSIASRELLAAINLVQTLGVDHD